MHGVFDDTTDGLEAFVGPHGGDGVSLHQQIALGEQLECFQGGAVGAQDALAALDEAVLVADQVADLDDVHGHVVLEDLDGLGRGHATREELDQVAGGEDGGRVVRLSCGCDGHGALDEVEGGGDAMFLERRLDELPRAFEVLFAVFGEERGEAGLFGERAGCVVFGVEGLDLIKSLAKVVIFRGRKLRAPSTCQCRLYPRASRRCAWTALRRLRLRLLVFEGSGALRKELFCGASAEVW